MPLLVSVTVWCFVFPATLEVNTVILFTWLLWKEGRCSKSLHFLYGINMAFACEGRPEREEEREGRAGYPIQNGVASLYSLLFYRAPGERGRTQFPILRPDRTGPTFQRDYKKITFIVGPAKDERSQAHFVSLHALILNHCCPGIPFPG